MYLKHGLHPIALCKGRTSLHISSYISSWTNMFFRMKSVVSLSIKSGLIQSSVYNVWKWKKQNGGRMHPDGTFSGNEFSQMGHVIVACN